MMFNDALLHLYVMVMLKHIHVIYIPNNKFGFTCERELLCAATAEPP